MRRLSIVDVDGGHQPISRTRTARSGRSRTASSTTTLELREASSIAAGHRFATRCDTEVIPHLYERYGERLPAAPPRQVRRSPSGTRARAAPSSRATGSASSRSTTRRSATSLVFASELKSLLASGLVAASSTSRRSTPTSRSATSPGPRTPLAGVSKLMPGHVLVVEDGASASSSVLGVPASRARDSRRPLDGVAGATRSSALDEAVRLRLMSDVPLGAMLSGGLDSSLIVALMARHMTEPVKTFSVGFREDGDEQRARGRALRRRPLRHRPSRARALVRRRARVDLETLVWFIDEPVADLSALGFLALSELAAAARHRRALRPGRRRAARWLSQASRRVARSAVSRLRARGRSSPRGRSRRARRPRVARSAATLAAPTPAERLLAMSGRVDADRPRATCRGPALAHSSGSTAARSTVELSRLGPRTATRSPRRCTSTRSSRSSTTCCTTSTARRWRTRSRFACRSSTTRSSSSARRFRAT